MLDHAPSRQPAGDGTSVGLHTGVFLPIFHRSYNLAIVSDPLSFVNVSGGGQFFLEIIGHVCVSNPSHNPGFGLKAGGDFWYAGIGYMVKTWIARCPTTIVVTQLCVAPVTPSTSPLRVLPVISKLLRENLPSQTVVRLGMAELKRNCRRSSAE